MEEPRGLQTGYLKFLIQNTHEFKVYFISHLPRDKCVWKKIKLKANQNTTRPLWQKRLKISSLVISMLKVKERKKEFNLSEEKVPTM